uniref:Uncharacterized protein n=1 Tax=Lates calcarifer TaxID=8187 RepID=A0A4W6DT23_LATCA
METVSGPTGIFSLLWTHSLCSRGLKVRLSRASARVTNLRMKNCCLVKGEEIVKSHSRLYEYWSNSIVHVTVGMYGNCEPPRGIFFPSVYSQ